jgi:hypothetical protein
MINITRWWDQTPPLKMVHHVVGTFCRRGVFARFFFLCGKKNERFAPKVESNKTRFQNSKRKMSLIHKLYPYRNVATLVYMPFALVNKPDTREV